MLLLGVGLLVAIDLTILVIYTLVEGVKGRLGAEQVENRENPMSMDGVSYVIYKP